MTLLPVGLVLLLIVDLLLFFPCYFYGIIHGLRKKNWKSAAMWALIGIFKLSLYVVVDLGFATQDILTPPSDLITY
jgi:hypothetical protein